MFLSQNFLKFDEFSHEFSTLFVTNTTLWRFFQQRERERKNSLRQWSVNTEKKSSWKKSSKKIKDSSRGEIERYYMKHSRDEEKERKKNKKRLQWPGSPWLCSIAVVCKRRWLRLERTRGRFIAHPRALLLAIREAYCFWKLALNCTWWFDPRVLTHTSRLLPAGRCWREI